MTLDDLDLILTFPDVQSAFSVHGRSKLHFLKKMHLMTLGDLYLILTFPDVQNAFSVHGRSKIHFLKNCTWWPWMTWTWFWPSLMSKILFLYMGGQKYTFWKIAFDDLEWPWPDFGLPWCLKCFFCAWKVKCPATEASPAQVHFYSCSSQLDNFEHLSDAIMACIWRSCVQRFWCHIKIPVKVMDIITRLELESKCVFVNFRLEQNFLGIFSA